MRLIKLKPISARAKQLVVEFGKFWEVYRETDDRYYIKPPVKSRYARIVFKRDDKNFNVTT